MSIDAATCATLICDIYDVALGRLRIERVLGDLARLGGVGRAAVIAVAPSGRKSIAAVSELDPSAIDDYNRDYHRLDTILPAGGAGPTVFVPGTTAAEAICPGYERGDFFNAWARPNGAHQIAFVTGGEPAGARSSLLLIAPPDDRRFGAPEQLDLLRLAGPHFLRMTQLVDRLAPAPREDAPLLAVIERWPLGVVALDARGGVSHVTRRARALLAGRDGFELAARGLMARQPAAQRRIDAMIAGALRQRSGAPDAPAPTVLVPRPSCRPPYVVRATALPARRGAAGDGDCAVLVTILDPVRAPRPRPEAVRAVFGLTRAEAEVALRIFDGGGLARAARETGIAPSTLRTHLLHVFEKTGVHRQADLVRLLAGLDPGPGD